MSNVVFGPYRFFPSESEIHEEYKIRAQRSGDTLKFIYALKLYTYISLVIPVLAIDVAARMFGVGRAASIVNFYFGFFVATIIFILIRYRFNQLNLNNNVEKLKAIEYVINIDTSGYSVVTYYMNNFINWSGIIAFSEIGSFIIFRTQANALIFIPKRIFPNADVQESIISLANTHINENGGAQEEAKRELLRNSSYKRYISPALIAIVVLTAVILIINR